MAMSDSAMAQDKSMEDESASEAPQDSQLAAEVADQDLQMLVEGSQPYMAAMFLALAKGLEDLTDVSFHWDENGMKVDSGSFSEQFSMDDLASVLDPLASVVHDTLEAELSEPKADPSAQ